ncbi:isoleucyl-tRNA synthetase [Aureococcus anophagefferens]|uniref:Isoleucyl-tRNA synthetase n=1 Tax=Aureococcus anophagefferens TaxID=44056 RepID=A0ABR1FSI7_AURAN
MMVFAFLATARALSLRPAFSASRRGLAKRSGGRRAATVEQASPEAVEDEDRYRGTVLLPETSFGQRANAINKEPELQKFWADTKVLKDFINRYRSLRGDKVRYVPGWDCHGLPIELKVLQAINAENKKIKKKTGATPPPLTPLELRRRAAGFAEETPAYEAAQLRVFATMFEQGHIYRGLKPVWYSPSSRTARRPSSSTGRPHVAVRHAALDVLEPSAGLAAVAGGEHAKLAVWTTTPWTLPANLAVAVNGDLDHAVVDSPKGALVVAVDLVDALAAKFACELTVRGSLKGAALAGTTYARPVATARAPGARPAAVVVGGDYITSEGGTGLVHTAPGHGMDDYQTGLKHDLPPFSPVDAAGKFTADAGDGLEGLPWTPPVGRNRIAAMTEQRGDWCISRQRSWGVPLPVFYAKATGEPLVDAGDAEHAEALVAEKGSDAWFELDVADLLPPGELRDAADDYVKGTDTMDVWFDSARPGPASSSSAPELGKGGGAPADLYLEGSDQHRGWFQSSLLTSVACRGAAGGGNKGALYKAVLTHGFVLDEKGFKMSKSLGNVVDPRVVIEGGKNAKVDPPYGADVFEQYRKLRNTLRYMAGNVNGAPTRGTDAFAAYDARDAAHLRRALERECFDAYENYQFSRAVGAISAFAVNELSALYLDVAKDRMRVAGRGGPPRVTCMATLVACLDVLPRLLAPLLPHLAEELFQALPYAAGDAYSAERGSVFDRPRGDPWDGTNLAPYAAHEEATFAAVRAFRDDANRALEAARRDKVLGASLDARRETKATVGAAPATALRCLRCWYHEDSVGDSPDHPTLCARCDDAGCEPALQVQLPDFK